MPRRDRSTGVCAIGDFSDPALIATLTAWLGASGACELEITTQDGRGVKIVLSPNTCPALVRDAAPEMPAAQPQDLVVKAPLAGLFRDRHPGVLDASLLAGEGRTLEAGAIAGFVEVGPILLPVTAPEAAVVAEVHARAGELVGYGDPILTTEHAQ